MKEFIYYSPLLNKILIARYDGYALMCKDNDEKIYMFFLIGEL